MSGMCSGFLPPSKNMHVRHIRQGWPNVAACLFAAAQDQPSALTLQFCRTIHCIMTISCFIFTFTNKQSKSQVQRCNDGLIKLPFHDNANPKHPQLTKETKLITSLLVTIAHQANSGTFTLKWKLKYDCK